MRDSLVDDGTGEQVLAESVVSAMRGWRKFHFHDTGKSAPAKQKRKIDDKRALRAEGENLAPFLFALQSVAPGSYRTGAVLVFSSRSLKIDRRAARFEAMGCEQMRPCEPDLLIRLWSPAGTRSPVTEGRRR